MQECTIIAQLMPPTVERKDYEAACLESSDQFTWTQTRHVAREWNSVEDCASVSCLVCQFDKFVHLTDASLTFSYQILSFLPSSRHGKCEMLFLAASKRGDVCHRLVPRFFPDVQLRFQCNVQIEFLLLASLFSFDEFRKQLCWFVHALLWIASFQNHFKKILCEMSKCSAHRKSFDPTSQTNLCKANDGEWGKRKEKRKLVLCVTSGLCLVAFAPLNSPTGGTHSASPSVNDKSYVFSDEEKNIFWSSTLEKIPFLMKGIFWFLSEGKHMPLLSTWTPCTENALVERSREFGAFFLPC